MLLQTINVHLIKHYLELIVAVYSLYFPYIPNIQKIMNETLSFNKFLKNIAWRLLKIFIINAKTQIWGL